MLSRIEVRHFQSLHHVEVELDRFTVIVGASSSGKSAFTRALRTLTSNARGTSFIEHGEQTCTITAEADSGTVAIAKGKQDWYKVVPREGDPKTFTKLHSEVPEEVTRILGIQSKDPINYAGQFDMPYLLKASPSEVARILGELTNADIVFTAAKESNRRRLAASSTLRVKVDDLAGIEEASSRYVNLRANLDALASAETAFEQAQSLQGQIDLLDRLSSTYEGALERHERALAASEVILPTAAAAEAAAARLETLIDLLKRTSALSKVITTANESVTAEDAEVTRLEARYIAALHEAGKCPTCGQDTTGVAHV